MHVAYDFGGKVAVVTGAGGGIGQAYAEALAGSGARATVTDVFIEQIVGALALKRQGTPADLVGMCQFLLSDAAAWVTGHVFNVDGGQVMRP
jgi:NAD(P)-dependent dehydrogenase (short-subunit alcohol dehydrogenase family)